MAYCWLPDDVDGIQLLCHEQVLHGGSSRPNITSLKARACRVPS